MMNLPFGGCVLDGVSSIPHKHQESAEDGRVFCYPLELDNLSEGDTVLYSRDSFLGTERARDNTTLLDYERIKFKQEKPQISAPAVADLYGTIDIVRIAWII